MLKKVLENSATFLVVAGTTIGTPKYISDRAGNTTVPTRQILSTIKGKTQIPIFIPSRLPFPGNIYYNSEVTTDSYSISFDYTPDCHGTTACNIGYMEAEKDGELTTPLPGVTRTFKHIRLAGGVRGIFHNGCGAYCTATVEWIDRGVLYRVSVKNGKEAETIQIANSAIQGGSR